MCTHPNRKFRATVYTKKNGTSYYRKFICPDCLEMGNEDYNGTKADAKEHNSFKEILYRKFGSKANARKYFRNNPEVPPEA